jgi:hypothetical protein
MSVRDYDLAHVPDLGQGIIAQSSAYGDGRPVLGAGGRPLIQLSDHALSSMEEAVTSVFHEIHHITMQMVSRGANRGTEAAAENFGVSMLARYLSNVGRS